MRFISIFLISIFLSGCSFFGTKQEATGEWVWVHSELYEKMAKGELTQNEVRKEYLKLSSTCKIQSLQIPVPSPSCSTMPYSCDKYTGFCKEAYQSCDYSSVNYAKKAQAEIFENCMIIGGWHQVWETYATGGSNNKDI